MYQKPVEKEKASEFSSSHDSSKVTEHYVCPLKDAAGRLVMMEIKGINEPKKFCVTAKVGRLPNKLFFSTNSEYEALQICSLIPIQKIGLASHPS